MNSKGKRRLTPCAGSPSRGEHWDVDANRSNHGVNNCLVGIRSLIFTNRDSDYPKIVLRNNHSSSAEDDQVAATESLDHLEWDWGGADVTRVVVKLIRKDSRLCWGRRKILVPPLSLIFNKLGFSTWLTSWRTQHHSRRWSWCQWVVASFAGQFPSERVEDC